MANMSQLKKDILRTYDRLSGNKIRKIITCFRTPGVKAVVVFRFGQWIRNCNFITRIFLEPIYIILNDYIRSRWGIELPRDTQIGEGCYIGHYGGVVINSSAIIGKNVAISHQVTIGVSGKGEKRGCPIIGNDVYIAPGAKLFGKIRIGNNVKIGANAVVHKDVPDNAIVVLYPGFKIISNDGNHVSD